MLDGKCMQGTDDPHQQHEPEEEPTDGKKQCCYQQPEMELCDNSQSLICRSLHDNGPTDGWNRNSAKKPVLSIRSQTQLRSRVTMQCLLGAWQFVHYCPQDTIVLGCGDEFTTIIDNANHQISPLLLLCLNDCTERLAQINKRETGR